MRHRFCEHEACGHPEPPCRRSGTSQPRGRVQRAGLRQPSKARTRDIRGVDTMTPQVETPELIYRGLDFFDLCGGPLAPGETLAGVCRTCRTAPPPRRRPRRKKGRETLGADLKQV